MGVSDTSSVKYGAILNVPSSIPATSLEQSKVPSCQMPSQIQSEAKSRNDELNDPFLLTEMTDNQRGCSQHKHSVSKQASFVNWTFNNSKSDRTIDESGMKKGQNTFEYCQNRY